MYAALERCSAPAVALRFATELTHADQADLASDGGIAVETATLMNVSVVRFEIPKTRASQYGRDLRSDVRHALQHGDRHMVVDCEAWNELDLNTLSSLIQCASACREQGAQFEVTNMSTNIRAAVRALHLNERLGIAD